MKIREIKTALNKTVELHGWLAHKRGSKKFLFIQFRDGSGTIQVIASLENLGQDAFNELDSIGQESSMRVKGKVMAHPKNENEFELDLTEWELISASKDYPITPKEHGVDFLHNNRHLWLRSSRQLAILSVRHEIVHALREFFYDQKFKLIDTPILTKSAGESSDNQFRVEYFDLGNANLAQTGQLYLETAIFAFGEVYCLGPTFRAEKSKTRKHLTEFWMLEAEMAFYENDDSINLQEAMVYHVIKHVLKNCGDHLLKLERDVSKLEAIEPNFDRLDYNEAVDILKAKGSSITHGMDLGAEDEAILVEGRINPVFIVNYPAECKAFYMKEHPSDSSRVLCADLLAPEGYGEIIGGSQREENIDTITEKLKAKNLDPVDYAWYLDLRRYGSVPHSGFGMGIERLVAWICGIGHVREAIPYPRMMSRLEP